MNDGYPADGKKGLISSLIRKISRKSRKDEDVTEEEIIGMVNECHKQGALEEKEAEMINNIFQFADKQAQDVMTHRKNVVAIDCNITVEEAFNFIINENFSRYPVYDTGIDNIIGILHIRDLLKVYADESSHSRKLVELKKRILFDASYIPETRKLSVLFKAMQSKKVHMAVVVDEYGQTSGVITMEDILEEIVGNIFDEYDEEDRTIVKQTDGTYIIAGQTYLEDIEDVLDIKFDCEDIDTINGYLIYKIGRIPKNAESIEITYSDYKFTALEVNNRMITRVKVAPFKE